MDPSRQKPTRRQRAVTPRPDGGLDACGHRARDEAAGPRGAAAEPESSELRCTCGSLVARYVDGKVELKCRRCKRTIWIAVSAEGEPAA
jgi:hypothetical protein